MSSKVVIREKYIAIRKGLSKKRRVEASEAAKKQLLKMLSKFTAILSFASKTEEINLWPLNKELARKKHLILPRVVSGSEILPFQVNNLREELLLHPRWKVLEPNPDVCKQFPLQKIDCALIPGVAFDQRNGRLGYGEGFYDRFLGQLSCPLIGVGFKEQLLALPFRQEKHDILLTKIYLF